MVIITYHYYLLLLIIITTYYHDLSLLFIFITYHNNAFLVNFPCMSNLISDQTVDFCLHALLSATEHNPSGLKWLDYLTLSVQCLKQFPVVTVFSNVIEGVFFYRENTSHNMCKCKMVYVLYNLTPIYRHFRCLQKSHAFSVRSREEHFNLFLQIFVGLVLNC